MDSLTHIVLGAAVGEAMLGKKIGKKGMLLGALFHSLPDIDVAANFFTDNISAALIHRGITHSLFFALCLSPVLVFIFSKYFTKHMLTKRQWLKFFLITLILHDLIDVQTSYGTELLAPFSRTRFALNNIFVADPFFTFPLLVTFIILLIFRKENSKRIFVNKAGILCSSAYLLFTFANKIHVANHVKAELQNQNIVYSDLMTTPAPLNNFLWYIIART